MARSKRTSLEVIEGKIDVAKAEVSAAKDRYDNACKKLKELMNKRDLIRNDILMDAVAKSKHSYEEIMAFLVEDDKEED